MIKGILFFIIVLATVAGIWTLLPRVLEQVPLKMLLTVFFKGVLILLLTSVVVGLIVVIF